jgi:hypothetical protein
MTKHPSSEDIGALPEGNEYDCEDTEIDISGLLKGPLSFTCAQYFNEIIHEKMRPKKIAKFKTSRKLESDF